jgi:hypothetical protein
MTRHTTFISVSLMMIVHTVLYALPMSPTPSRAGGLAVSSRAAHSSAAGPGTRAAAAHPKVAVVDSPAKPSRWLMPLLLVSAACSFGALLLLAIPLIRESLHRRTASGAAKGTAAVDHSPPDLAQLLQQAQEQWKKTADEIAGAIEGRTAPALEHLVSIAAQVGILRQEVATFGKALESVSPAQVTRSADPVALEHQILGECWKQFRSNKELSASFDAAALDASWEPLLSSLASAVPDDLKPTFDAVVRPCRVHRKFISRIGLVPRLVNGEIPRLPADAEEVRRTREFAGLLHAAQNRSESSNPLSFRIKSWVTDSFLSFADLYLQRYQQAQLEKRQAELQSGADLVRQVLRIAAVEAIEIEPGETSFDSTRHIGRSTTNDPRFADGVITGVVRNGFIESGRQVIRQPEVIVNRTR